MPDYYNQQSDFWKGSTLKAGEIDKRFDRGEDISKNLDMSRVRLAHRNKDIDTITFEKAFYVKLGRKGDWEEASLRENVIRIGWRNQTLKDINNGAWGEIQEQLEREIADHGVAVRDCRALRMICESTHEDIWITFHASKMYWCKVLRSGVIEKDTVSKYRRVQPWRCTNIFGKPLLTAQIPGTIAKVQGFRGTICKVKEVDDLCRLINGKQSSEYHQIKDSRDVLCSHVEQGIKKLHWKDFETLVDLMFRASGWRRISVLGETMKFSDVELEEPITGDMYQVQVKSRASLKDFSEYARRVTGEDYRKLYFVVHTPDKKLAEAANGCDDKIELILPHRLAEMVVELGLLNWLMNKIQ